MTFGSLRGCPECFSDFGFGFNDAKFSDRTLLLSIKPDPISNGGEADVGADSSSTETKTIHISSIVLAAKSLFFYKLFSNGMVESNQKHTKLVIQESEEAAFMDLFEFMYTNMLASTTPSASVNVLFAAGKYGVESCMKYCFQLLMKLPITCESTLLFLDLPSTVLMDDRAQILMNRAKNLLVVLFSNIRMFQKELLNLPLAAIEVVLSSDYLRLNSEDEIFDFVLQWAQKHYTERNIRQTVLNEHLLSLIRFSFTSRSKLEEVLTCSDISLEHRSKLVFDAISHETMHRQLPPVNEHERLYKLRPVKVIRFNSPDEECLVYLDLKREECTRLLPNGRSIHLIFTSVVKHFTWWQSMTNIIIGLTVWDCFWACERLVRWLILNFLQERNQVGSLWPLGSWSTDLLKRLHMVVIIYLMRLGIHL